MGDAHSHSYPAKGGFFFRNVASALYGSLVHASAMGGYFDGIHWGV